MMGIFLYFSPIIIFIFIIIGKFFSFCKCFLCKTWELYNFSPLVDYANIIYLWKLFWICKINEIIRFVCLQAVWESVKKDLDYVVFSIHEIFSARVPTSTARRIGTSLRVREVLKGGGVMGAQPPPLWISEIYNFQGVFGPQQVLRPPWPNSWIILWRGGYAVSPPPWIRII